MLNKDFNINNLAGSSKMFDKLTATLSLINLLTNSAYSSIVPFYPLEATKKGIDPILIGNLQNRLFYIVDICLSL